jgi:hypothetical protein
MGFEPVDEALEVSGVLAPRDLCPGLTEGGGVLRDKRSQQQGRGLIAPERWPV